MTPDNWDDPTPPPHSDDEAPDWLTEADRPPDWPAPDPTEELAPAPEPDPPLTVVVSDTAAVLPDGWRGTDSGNSYRLADLAAGRIRYVKAWGKWIIYEAGAWRIDTSDALITELAKAVPRHMFARSIDLEPGAREAMFKWAGKSESAGSVSAMIRLARGIDGIIVDHHHLDAHPWLLNCANGTVDLRTGELGPHDPAHLITCQTPTPYEPGSNAPRWKECLDTWQPDPDVRDYLQRIIGSAASGHPVEHVFVNLGGGANGKGKFYRAVSDVLGPDYAVVPHKSLLIVQRHEQHDTVKARLFGARMAVAGETEAGDRIDEAKVKELTGGDLLEARRMREDPWQFAPSHTLFLHTNHRPRVRGGDEGIWRRLRLIPWDVTIAPGDRDERLSERLAEEAPGILNWVVDGCRAWQAHGGFGQPAAVAAATSDYRSEEDHVGRFLTECCNLDDETRAVTAGELRQAYEEWCESVGETPWSAKALGAQLLAKGLDRIRDSHTRRWSWIGVQVLSDRPDQEMF